MTNQQLKKKIKELLVGGIGVYVTESSNERLPNKLLSLCKKYALSVLPEKKKDPKNYMSYKRIHTDGFNQAIKQAKEKIE